VQHVTLTTLRAIDHEAKTTLWHCKSYKEADHQSAELDFFSF
jgi:hypothetical protein